MRAIVRSWLNAKRDKKVAATRGSVRIVGFEPCFGVADVARSGSLREARFHDLVPHETYAFAHRDNLTIHLAQGDDPTTGAAGALYLHVDDADQLADDWRKAGMQVVGPEDFDYGKREGSHGDPDGILIRFGSP